MYSNHTLPAIVLAALAILLPSVGKAQTELRWKLQPGQQFAVSVQQQTTSDVAYSGKKAATQIDLTMELAWTVTSADEKAITIRQALRRLVFTMESPKVGKVEYDSAAKARPSGQAREVAASVAPLLEAEVDITISPRGEVQGAKPANEAAERLLASEPDAAGAPLLSKESIQQLLRQPLVILPEKAVAEGDTWTKSAEIASTLGKLPQETTYRYAGSLDQDGVKLENIEITTGLDLPKSPAGGAKLTIKEHEQSGTVLFSLAEGRVVSAEQTQKLVTERPYREMTIVVTLTSKQTTTLKPQGERGASAP